MTFDQALADRVRGGLAQLPGLSEKRMFGGLCFLLDGQLTAGIVGSSLVIRVGPEQQADLLAEPHAREMNFTGRPARGMIYVDRAGLLSEPELARWLERAVAVVGAEPSTPAAAGKARPGGLSKPVPPIRQ